MNSLDQQVITQLSEWLEAGQQCWLCTIIKTFGSSPRPIGSLLVCNEDGRYCGSLSGGCVEDELRESIRRGELATRKPERVKYGVAAEDVLRLGLPCGGTLEVVIEPISPALAAQYRDLAEKMAVRQLVTRVVDLNTGDTHFVNAEEANTEDTHSGGDTGDTHFKRTRVAGTGGTGDTHCAADTGDTHSERIERYPPLEIQGHDMRHTYGPSFQLLLVGAVQVASFLAEMGCALDYRVEVCDPRGELLESFPIKDIPTVKAMPDDWLRSKTIDQRTAVVALCHDPRIDDMALMEALKSDAFYVGAMGSERTSRQRRERLAMLDLSPAEIARLHAPVGLAIGSKTPAEIAIAIMAELTQLRAGPRPAKANA